MGPLNIVYLVSFLDLFAVGLTFPLFSTHLRELGASHFTIGLISSAYAGIQVVSGPLIGSWSDVRDRKTVLNIVLICCSILYGSLGIPTSLILIFLIRVLLGVVKHIQTLTKAIITDIVPSSESSAAFGRSAAYANIGFTLGPFIGGYLSDFENGFIYVCFISAVLYLINLGIAFNLPQPEIKSGNYGSLLLGVKTELSKTVKELVNLDWKRHWLSFFIRFLFGLALTSYFSNQTVYLKEKYGLSQKLIGYTISFYSTIGMVVGFFLKQINKLHSNDKLGYQRLSIYFGISSICFFSIYLSTNFIVFLLCLLPLSLSSTILRVVSMDLMLKEGEESQKGSLSGASNSVMSIARFISPLLCGIVGQLFGDFVILLAVVPTLIGALTCYYMHRYAKKEKSS